MAKILIVDDEPDVLEFQKYLEYLRTTVGKSVEAGKSGDELVGAVLPELTKSYGSWNFFKDFSRSNILDVAAEIRGSKRVPPRNTK